MTSTCGVIGAGPPAGDEYIPGLGNNILSGERPASVGGPGKYYPYGQERETTPQETEKFATYYRDAPGLDYAWNRHYISTWGRFMQADPYLSPDAMNNPQGWNRYAYVENDPVNFYDPAGLIIAVPVPFPPLPEVVNLTTVYRGTDALGERSAPLPELADTDRLGTGGGVTVTAKISAVTRSMGAALQRKLGSMSGSNCEKVFTEQAGMTLAWLGDAADALTFYDASDPVIASLPMSSVVNTGSSQTIGSFAAGFPGAWAVTVTTPGQGPGGQVITPNVILTQAFWSGSTEEQQVVLLHEAIHYRLQLNDKQLVDLFRISMGPWFDNSEALSRWLRNDCKNRIELP